MAANWLIGQQIVEAEQRGDERAAYGTRLLELLSARLSAEYGTGFSLTALKYTRQFFIEYPGLLLIGHAARDQLGEAPSTFGEVTAPALRTASTRGAVPEWQPGHLHSALSWTHYRALLKVSRPDARAFYEIEVVRAGWSARQLERQIHSLLYERLTRSRDTDGVLALADEGLVPHKPADIIKDPYVLEFLDLPESYRLTESRLEQAIITQLRDFLLELGRGFAFIGRQVRLTLDGDHFYPDLVFYHVKLKCYVVIDLKVGKLEHGDLGQTQSYVHYYDQEMVDAEDNPTIGLVLCTDKNDAVVRYVLGDDQRQIFASRYQFHLPSEAELRAELKRELERLDGPVPEGGRN